jgi:hypothetical protein
MKDNKTISLDNKTIAKLAIAIATAIKLEREVIGPLTRKVLERLDEIDSLKHFIEYPNPTQN